MTSKSRLAVGALLLSLCTSTAAYANRFGVQVVDDNGQPVVGASVCVGLPGNFSQFGASFTDKQGQVMTDVPNVPFVVTVSKTRFSGIRISEPARNFNLIKQVVLTEGVPGPRCKAGSSLADHNRSSVRITNVAIDSAPGRATVILPQAVGEPTEYRLSASQTLGSAAWRKLDKQIVLTNRLANAEQVFLQLRRYEGTRSSWVEAVSEVVTVYLPTAR